MSEAVGEEDEDLLQQAIALSMQQEKRAQEQSTANAPSAISEVNMQDDDEEMRLALQMSMASSPSPNQPTTSTGGEDISKELMEDPNFVNSILMSLPGVDPDDDRIKNALKQLEQKKDKNEK